ncbi:MAG: hypothetical protein Q9219_000681 [cf. Caloplaca sp. 3 TL-2023]
MESQDLTTASTYINNLLLSRGLLRDGKSIDFTVPKTAGGEMNTTMAKTMNLVHDLILQRDRDVDTLGNLSQTMHTLRSSSAQQTQSISRLEARNADLERQLAASNVQDQNAKKAHKQAELTAKAVEAEMLKLKGSVSQIRQQCAKDIRRRDQELARLKRHLEGRRGREGNGGQIGVTVITPGITKPPPGSKDVGTRVDLASSQYNLRQETTEFLTQLSQGLSDENDALIGLVRGTLSNLRNLQGLPPDPILQPYNVNDQPKSDFANVIMTAPPSYEALASSTDNVMANLHTLLTNPSFVPLEEVQIRDDEIQKLRGAWEKMEARWREAVALMDSWRKRMEHTGDTINLDDLKIGMDLGIDLPAAPSPSQRIHLPRLEDEIVQQEPRIFEDVSEGSEKTFAKTSDENDEMERSDNVNETGQVLPETNALRSRSGNARPSLIPRKISCPDIPEENTKAIRDFEEELISDLCNENRHMNPSRSISPAQQEVRILWSCHTDTELTQMQMRSPPASPRSIQSKLEKARAEAEETRKIEEKNGRRRSGVVKKLRGSRRRSTLSPEELEKLMGIV